MADKFAIGDKVWITKGPNHGLSGKVSGFNGLGRVIVNLGNGTRVVHHYSWMQSAPAYQEAIDQYFVMNATTGKNPTKLHKTYESALAEASRLSIKQPKDRFVVLHCVDEIVGGCC